MLSFIPPSTASMPTAFIEQLPAELWYSVLGYIPQHELRQSLTVSKQWHAYAERVIAASPEFNLQMLLGFHRCPEKTRNLFSDTAQRLDVLVLSRTSSWPLKKRINESLCVLATDIPLLAKLKIFQLRVYQSHSNYLQLGPTQQLINALVPTHITDLTMDTSGSDILVDPDHPEVKVHLCECLSVLIPKLRRLYVRMKTMCPDLLNPNLIDANSPLESLILNVSLTYANGTRGTLPTSISFARQCIESGPTLHTQMVQAVKRIVPLLPRIRMARVIGPRPHDLAYNSKDCITRKRFVVEDGCWDDHGVPFDEYEPPSDSSDSDSEESDPESEA